MRRCPQCRRDYYDDSLSYCLDDGVPLVYGVSSEISLGDQTEMLPTYVDRSDIFPAIPNRSPQPRTAPRRKAVALIAGLGVILAASVFLGDRYLTSNGNRINSLAVMPLKALNDDENAKILGLGLTDALITKLGSLPNVVVRPTSAITSLTGANTSTDVGQRLSVDAVLEGTIQEADGRLRVNARLIRTSTGEQIWADKFEQPATNLFAIQDALSSSIAKALTFELSKSDSEQLVRRGTNNTEAYEKYLRGRFFQTQNTGEGLERSIELYEQAAALDPGFAEAYAGIADANLILFNLGIRPAGETIPNARRALTRAQQLNGDLSNIHTALALIQFLIDRNWPEAERSLKRAIELNPNNPDAYLRYGYFLINVGRFDEALEKLFKARELNPLSPITQTNIGMAYMFSRRHAEAVDQLERTAAENPQFTLAQWLLGLTYEESGDGERAFVENLKALESEGGGSFAVELKKVRNDHGLESANRLWFAESAKRNLGVAPIEEQKEPSRISALLVALRAATVKEREQTLLWLARAQAEKDPTLYQIKYLSKFDFVRDDARFRAIAEGLVFE